MIIPWFIQIFAVRKLLGIWPRIKDTDAPGVNINRRNLNKLRYADDTTLTAGIKEEMIYL